MIRARAVTLAPLACLLAAPSAADARGRRFVALSPFTANTLASVGVRPVGIANTLGGDDRFFAACTASSG